MPRLLVFLLLLAATAATAQTPPPLAWTSDLTAALQQAKMANKPVLVVFSGSDWCKPCIMLKQEVFDAPAFAPYAADRFVLARFDFPRSKKNKLPATQTLLNEQAAAQLNRTGEFPLVLLLSPAGKVLARSGYRPGGLAAFEQYFAPFLGASAK